MTLYLVIDPRKWRALLSTLQQEFTRENLNFAAEYVKVLKASAPHGEFPRLLDIGMGEGPKETAMLRKEGYDVTGITIQPWMRRDDTAVLMMDMHDQKFAPDSYDVVYSTQVFEHSYAPWLLLLETWVTLRPGGRLFIALPSPYLHIGIHHPSQFGTEIWRRMLEQTGFKVLSETNTFMIEEPVVMFVAEKSEPPDPHVKEALAELSKIRGMREFRGL